MGRAVMPIEDVVDAQTDLTVLIGRIDRIPCGEQVRLRLIGRLFGWQLDALCQIGCGEIGRPFPTLLGEPTRELNPPEASFPAEILLSALHLRILQGHAPAIGKPILGLDAIGEFNPRIAEVLIGILILTRSK